MLLWVFVSHIVQSLAVSVASKYLCAAVVVCVHTQIQSKKECFTVATVISTLSVFHSWQYLLAFAAN